MSYHEKKILTEKIWNNAFAWDERMRKYGTSPRLTIPSLIDGTLDDVQIGEDIVFEEVEDGVLRSCRWLRHFVRIISETPVGWGFGGDNGTKIEDWERTSQHRVVTPETFVTFSHESKDMCPEIIIFDNHNHALYFWIEAVRRWILKPGFELIHIDEHSDLWSNKHSLDLERALSDEQYAWDFTNLSCNVGNYIIPARESWLVGSMIRIENEYQIDEHLSYTPSTNSVLNIDIDIFAPELDHIPEAKKIMIIQHLLKQVKFVTIATSPYFIEQWTALEKVSNILAY